MEVMADANGVHTLAFASAAEVQMLQPHLITEARGKAAIVKNLTTDQPKVFGERSSNICSQIKISSPGSRRGDQSSMVAERPFCKIQYALLMVHDCVVPCATPLPMKLADKEKKKFYPALPLNGQLSQNKADFIQLLAQIVFLWLTKASHKKPVSINERHHSFMNRFPHSSDSDQGQLATRRE